MASKTPGHERLVPNLAPIVSVAPQPTDSFFIDSINEKSNTNGRFEPGTPYIVAQEALRPKTWRSESSLVNFREGQNYGEYETYDDYDEEANEDEDDDMEEGEDEEEPLQFSDHAGLFENDYQGEDPSGQASVHVDEDDDEIRRRLLLNNYDIYRMKKNYRLTYNDQRHQNNNNHVHGQRPGTRFAIRNNHQDSLISSAVMRQSSQLDESNYMAEEDDEFDERNQNEDSINDPAIYDSKGK